MCTNMFAWLLKILCQTFIAFDQNKIIYDKKQKKVYLDLHMHHNLINHNMFSLTPLLCLCSSY